MAAEKKVKVKALVAIEHDGKRYETGQELAIEESQVKALQDVGAIEATKEKVTESAAS